MNTAIILFSIALVALVVNTLFLDRTVRYLDDELDAVLHDIDEMELQAKAQADLCKSLVSMITDYDKRLNDYDKRLDKFEFAVERAENETNFAEGVDAIFSYDAMTALKAAKKERGDA